MNRRFFAFNDQVDQFLLVPVTNAYRFVVPSPVRMCVRRTFRNLRAPVYFVNNLLQLRFQDAAETLAGFALNSTAGIVGLFVRPPRSAGSSTPRTSARRSASTASRAGPIW